jgi:hypothetical protein
LITIFDNNWDISDFTILNNFEVMHPGVKLTDKHLWFKIKTILNDQSSLYNYSIIIDSRQRPRSEEGNFIWSAPNPFNVSGGQPMVIEYEISDQVEKVEVLIIDSGGTIVTNWDKSELGINIGRNRIANGWDGRNKNSQRVSSGMYLLILKIDNEIKSSWMMALR